MEGFLGKVKYFIIFLALLLLQQNIVAQNVGRIKGTITDASTGEALPGVNVMLEGTNLGAATGRFGNFLISKVPFGDYTLIAKYIGYKEYSRPIEVSRDNRIIEIDIEMELTAVKMEDVVVSGIRKGQVKALNRQKNSETVISVLSQEEMGKFPDMNTAESLQRIPGISITRSLGEGQFVNIRGTRPRLTNVTVNGHKLATPREQDRFIGLDVVNSDQLASIEVIKVHTPEMDADAIGGTVELNTRSPFDYQQTTRLNASLGGGLRTIGNVPLYRGSLNYSTLFGDNNNIGVNLGVNFYRNNIMAHSNEYDWVDVETVQGNTLERALADYRLYRYNTIRDHYGINGALEYKPNDQTLYYIRGMYNRATDDQNRHQVRYRLDKGDYLNETSVSGGRLAYELNRRNEINNLYSINVGGRNSLDLFDIDYSLSYSRGEEETGDEGQIKSEWQIRGINYAFDISDRDFPEINLINKSQDFYFDPSVWSEDGSDYRERTSFNTKIIGDLNIKYPYFLGSHRGDLKAGLKLIRNQKERNNERYEMEWEGDDISMAVAGSEGTIDDFMLDHYKFGPLMDGQAMYDFMMNNIDPNNGFRKVPDIADSDGLGGRFDASEDVYAGYLMTTMRFNRLMVLAGLRSEFTQTTYKGWNMIMDAEGRLMEKNETDSDNSYNNLFPALHFKYDISPKTNLRLAYTQGISRPDYFDLAPYRWVIPDDDEIVVGNPDLNPTESSNIDLMFGHYFQGIGAINAGLFYKNLDQIIYRVVTQIEGGAYDGYDKLGKVNGGTADLYGVEVSWMQQFTFLPGFWNGFGVYANYTLTESNVDLKYSERDILPGQAGNVGNFGFSYEKYDISSRLTLNYTSELLVELGEDGMEFDRWEDDKLILDFSGTYEFLPGYEFFLQVSNITNEPNKVYYHVPKYPRENEYHGRSIRAGFKVTL